MVLHLFVVPGFGQRTAHLSSYMGGGILVNRTCCSVLPGADLHFDLRDVSRRGVLSIDLLSVLSTWRQPPPLLTDRGCLR